MEELKKRIGYLIKQARIGRGLTQKELGELISASESQISRYESGTINISADTITKIADALKYDILINFTIK
jgi:UDP-N-acetylglucosamine 1-carboxyvinyltransferase